MTPNNARIKKEQVRQSDSLPMPFAKFIEHSKKYLTPQELEEVAAYETLKFMFHGYGASFNLELLSTYDLESNKIVFDTYKQAFDYYFINKHYADISQISLGVLLNEQFKQILNTFGNVR